MDNKRTEYMPYWVDDYVSAEMSEEIYVGLSRSKRRLGCYVTILF